MKLTDDIEVDDREFLQDMLNALELQLTWPYSAEEKAGFKQDRDAIMKLLNKHDEEHPEKQS